MFPVLFEIFGIRIYTYGFLIALGIVIAYFLIVKLSKEEGLNTNKVENTILFALIGGLIVARLSYVIEHPEYVEGILDVGAIWQGGLNFFGGLIGGVLGVLLGIYIYKFPIWKIADISVIGLSIAHAIGRLGCTSAGCCYGKPIPIEGSLNPGIHFMDRFPFFYVSFPPGAVAPPYIPLYPTQIMEFLGLVFVFIILYLLYKRKPFDGFVFLMYMLLYGILRFSLEFLRGVTPPIESIGLTWNQLVSLAMIFIALALFFLLKKEKSHEMV